jgi:uncharacterized protein
MDHASSQARIQAIDALRGFALLGIAVLHAAQHFDLLVGEGSSDPFWQQVDHVSERALFFLLEGKAYAVFALLFGFGLHLQLRNGRQQGLDRRPVFLARMFVLLVIGWLHGLLYMGDILTVLATYGLLLLLLSELSNRALAVIMVLLFVKPHLLLALVFPALAPPLHVPWSVMEPGMEAMAHGGFADVVAYNAWQGQVAKWWFIVASGRKTLLPGLMIAGLLLARSGWLEKAVKDGRLLWRALAWSLPVLVLTIGSKQLLSGLLGPDRQDLLKAIFNSYRDVAFTAVVISAFLLVAHRFGLDRPRSPFVLQGRMSLTAYVAQAVIGAPLFYGYGAGLYQHVGLVGSAFMGLAIWLLCAAFAAWWPGRQGPLESLWKRSAERLARPRTTAAPSMLEPMPRGATSARVGRASPSSPSERAADARFAPSDAHRREHPPAPPGQTGGHRLVRP